MILEVNVQEPGGIVYTKSLYQYEKNVAVQISGIELPGKYIGYFSNTKDFGISVMRESASDGIMIPNELFMTGDYIYGWIYAINEHGKRQETLCGIIVPIVRRSIPVPIMIEDEDGGSSEPVEYEVEPEDENLIFKGAMNDIISESTEEED